MRHALAVDAARTRGAPVDPAPNEPDPTEVEPTDNSSGALVDPELAEEIEREARETDPGWQ